MKKKKEEVKLNHGSIYMETGMTLADVISQTLAAGVTDFSKVVYDRDYVSCQCDHGDSYCYCDSSYRDIRFDWEA